MVLTPTLIFNAKVLKRVELYFTHPKGLSSLLQGETLSLYTSLYLGTFISINTPLERVSFPTTKSYIKVIVIIIKVQYGVIVLAYITCSSELVLICFTSK